MTRNVSSARNSFKYIQQTRINLTKMREIARIVSFNGVKVDTMCDLSVLTGLPARLSGNKVQMLRTT